MTMGLPLSGKRLDSQAGNATVAHTITMLNTGPSIIGDLFPGTN